MATSQGHPLTSYLTADPNLPHTPRILLAEDHPVNQKIALLMLERLGYRADVAGNGLEVLEALRRQPYDVVFLDVQMPEMDGLEAARQICQHWPPQERPQLIAMTANAMQGDREICLNAGMDYYISKPVRMEELAQVLRHCPLRHCPILPAAPADLVAPPDRPDVLNRAVLDAFRKAMGDDTGAVLTELIDYYLAETPRLLAQMRGAIAQRDFTDLQRIAHGLKSSSASLGAIRLSQFCQTLELMSPPFIPEQVVSTFTQLESEYEAVAIALHNERLSQP